LLPTLSTPDYWEQAESFIESFGIVLKIEAPSNVWSAARLQGKSEESTDSSAQMYSAYRWRASSPGHDELRCVLFLINGTVIGDSFRAQVSSTPLGTVHLSYPVQTLVGSLRGKFGIRVKMAATRCESKRL
jgi:hypothetical protein